MSHAEYTWSSFYLVVVLSCARIPGSYAQVPGGYNPVLRGYTTGRVYRAALAAKTSDI